MVTLLYTSITLVICSKCNQWQVDHHETKDLWAYQIHTNNNNNNNNNNSIYLNLIKNSAKLMWSYANSCQLCHSHNYVITFRSSGWWYPASRGYIFAVRAGMRKVASANNHSIFYRACAKFITQFASNWFVKSARVSRESNLRKLPANYSPRAFVSFFCFAPSGFKYFSRKISMDRLF